MSAEGALVLLAGGVCLLALAVLKKLLVDEISGSLTSLSEHLIRLASARLAGHAERYREEWLAELAALKERRISGLRYAVGVLRGSRSLAATLARLNSESSLNDSPRSIAEVTPDLGRVAMGLLDRDSTSALARSRTSPQHFATFYE